MQASLSPVCHSVHHHQSSGSLIWPHPIDSKVILEDETGTGGVHLTLPRLMSGVHVYPNPYPSQRRETAIDRACNVTISSSWVIKNTVNDFDDDFDTVKREIRQLSDPKPDPLEVEFERLRTCVMKLEASGWYYGQLSWKEATDLLQSTEVGTFLVRDSSDPAYLFALSIQTECGPTSIRIHYADGQLKLDAEDLIAEKMPVFDCVVKLVNYYVDMSKRNKLSGTNHVWLDETGRRDRVILITRPLYCQVRSLQHLCRLNVHKNVPLQRIHELQLPKAMITFLNSYPHSR